MPTDNFDFFTSAILFLGILLSSIVDFPSFKI